MAKSKRDKVVHLTKVKKKGKNHKEDLAKQLDTYLSLFKGVFIFDFDSTKSDRIMSLRVKLKEHGRVFAGKNHIASTSLKSYAKKTKINIDNLIEKIKGHRGLLFTDLTQDELQKILSDELPEFSPKLLDYAKIG